MREAHSTQHVWCLGELDVLVTDDLDAIAPRVEEVEERAGQKLHSCGDQRLASRLLVVDHKPEVAAIVRGLHASLLEGEELIAQIDKGHGFALAAELEIEETPVER